MISSPGVNVPCGSRITSTTEISGDFSTSEAQKLAALIEGGALPLPMELISDRLVGPTLGEQAIDDSFQAGLIGILLTGLFITFVYRFVGFLATLALASYALIAYAMLLGLGATLTLPGLAGFVFAIGRLVVRIAWLQFGRQIKLAGGVFAVLALAIGVLLAKRQPPEG